MKYLRLLSILFAASILVSSCELSPNVLTPNNKKVIILEADNIGESDPQPEEPPEAE